MEPLPAIRRIDADRDDLCALEIVGRFTAADLENAYGLLQAAYERHDKIDVLIRISDYDGFDWNAALDESLVGLKSQALPHIRKYAVVGGPTWMRVALGLFGPFMSFDVRHFAMQEEAAAWAWIGGQPIVT
ncbi:MAG TPA: STAS/SEC14 domain-containing protein [Rhizobiaceae bacterium]|nr:STAS/SEC14 domain-containing protein [Rhizobiaceae bacterium]